MSGRPMDLAGKPSQVGGTVARVFGWVVLIGGLSLALLFGLLLAAIFPGTLAPWVVSLPIGFASLATAMLLLFGGRKLRESGAAAEQGARNQALFSLAQNRGGIVTARDASNALAIPLEQADALLTELAKSRPDEVGVEVSDQGEILYTFPGFQRRPAGPGGSPPGKAGRFVPPETGPARVAATDGSDWQQAEIEAQAAEEADQARWRKERTR
ncbi:hypothetical protein [Chondromyces crocatus]|nr:hypothetical protein [Chondromyces crocatus]